MFSIFFWIALFMYCIAFTVICGTVAEKKGLAVTKWSLLGFFLGIIAFVIISLKPSEITKEQ